MDLLWETQKAVGNRDYTLKVCTQNLACPETQDPGQKQQFKRNLGQIHLLILESLLEKEDAVKTCPGDIDASSSYFGEFILPPTGQNRY